MLLLSARRIGLRRGGDPSAMPDASQTRSAETPGPIPSEIAKSDGPQVHEGGAPVTRRGVFDFRAPIVKSQVNQHMVWINAPTPPEVSKADESHGIETTAAAAGEEPGAELESRAEPIPSSDAATQALDASEHQAILTARRAVGIEVTPELH